MIVQETFRVSPDSWELVKTWSDAGFMIRQVETGAIYEEAIDIYPCPYTYEETDEPIGGDGEIDAQETLDILLGGE